MKTSSPRLHRGVTMLEIKPTSPKDCCSSLDSGIDGESLVWIVACQEHQALAHALYVVSHWDVTSMVRPECKPRREEHHGVPVAQRPLCRQVKALLLPLSPPVVIQEPVSCPAAPWAGLCVGLQQRKKTMHKSDFLLCRGSSWGQRTAQARWHGHGQWYAGSHQDPAS